MIDQKNLNEIEKVKRQVRYKGAIYDVLKDIILGEYNYLIIGNEIDSKFIDIDFVEQRVEDDKIRYISPSMNLQFDKNVSDYTRLQGQSLMQHIIDEITDSINDKSSNREETINYIDRIAKVIDNSEDIKGFFKNSGSYDDEAKFEESIKTLIGYYDSEIREYEDGKVLPSGNVLVPEQTVNEIYDELENTQNFGVSAIYDYRNKQDNDDYIVDPTNNIFMNYANDNSKNVVKQEDIIDDKPDEMPAKSELSNDTETEEKENLLTETQIEEPKEMVSDNVSNLSFQERLYMENEQKLHSMHEQNKNDLQTDLKSKTLTIRPNYSKMNSAAYISISLLLYLIGSFELLLSIIMLVKFL